MKVRNQKGFTLIELLIVVAIIGIILIGLIGLVSDLGFKRANRALFPWSNA